MGIYSTLYNHCAEHQKYTFEIAKHVWNYTLCNCTFGTGSDILFQNKLLIKKCVSCDKHSCIHCFFILWSRCSLLLFIRAFSSLIWVTIKVWRTHFHHCFQRIVVTVGCRNRKAFIKPSLIVAFVVCISYLIRKDLCCYCNRKNNLYCCVIWQHWFGFFQLEHKFDDAELYSKFPWKMHETRGFHPPLRPVMYIIRD